ncbi:hypothetical protein C8R44DRAFT_898682 [Mycena epipterygia]|nr:hypothetical protein C8R44DRAFT_898682 [Mycena epipterygia]
MISRALPPPCFQLGKPQLKFYLQLGNHLIWVCSSDLGYTGRIFLAMVLHSECQVKAQEEINSVVGDLRLPDFEDCEKVPFIECILQETFRRVNDSF